MGRRAIAAIPRVQQVLKGLGAVNYSTDQIIYRPRNPMTDKIYGFCYDDATEILTQARGWVRFADLVEGDSVATRSSAGEFEWQVPSRIVREQWDGEMIRFGSRSVDLFVTPEHRMLVDTLPRALGGNRSREAGEAIITADELALFGSPMVKIPVTSWWRGIEVGEQVFEDQDAGRMIEVERVVGGSTQRFMRRKAPQTTVAMTGDDYCALMGAYLAEGNVRTQGGIEVSQLPKSKGFALFRDLFERLGGGFSGRAFVLPRRAITEHFRAFGHAHEKFIPAEVMNAPPRQLRIFWDHFMAGDGHYDLRLNLSGRGDDPTHTESLTTVSRRLADQLVEIAQKLA